MARNSKRRGPVATQHRYPREARLNQSLRQVIAEELAAIDDEALDLVTITQIDVDSEMNHATVFFDSLRGESGDTEILEALGRHRVRLQSAVGRQIRAKNTPVLRFKPDDVIRSAERIDRILRENPSPAVAADEAHGDAADDSADDSADGAA
jgi:ribosome-binding factor A